MKNKIHTDTIRWVLRSVGKSKYYILALIPLLSLLNLIGVGFSLQMRSLIDHATERDMDGFLHAAFVIIAMLAANLILSALSRFLFEWTRSGAENALKAHVFQLLLRKDYASVTAVHTGEWMNRLTNDVTLVANNTVDILPSIISTLVGLVGSVAAIIALQPLFAAVLIPGGLTALILSYSFRKILKGMHKAVRESDGRVRVFLQERLGSLMMIRTFGMEDVTARLARERMQEYRTIRIRRNHFLNLFSVTFSLGSTVLHMGGTVFCGYQILCGRMTYGTMMAIMQLVGQVQSPFATLSGYIPTFFTTLASAERLMEVDAFEDDCKEPKPVKVLKDCYRERFEELGLDDVTFSYTPPVADAATQMPVVLRKLSLRVKKGAYVALMGHSGCGKSTVLKLLMGIYPIQSGERYLKMTDGSHEELDSSWRGLFAYVPQGNQLMSGSIREILAFGDPKRMQEEEQMRLALRIACADEFLDTLPDGLDTVLGERGSGLSEGQMQRIAIARAIFSDRPILLLDEATSALDEQTEQRLLTKLRAMTDKTVIIVTHRTAVLSVCDTHIRLDDAQCTMIPNDQAVIGTSSLPSK